MTGNQLPEMLHLWKEFSLVPPDRPLVWAAQAMLALWESSLDEQKRERSGFDPAERTCEILFI